METQQITEKPSSSETCSPNGFCLPVNYFSIALGMLSGGLAFRHGSAALGIPGIYAHVFLAIAATIWAVLIVSYVYKWIYFACVAKQELGNIIQCCFISLIPITTILMGLVILPLHRATAIGFMTVGIIGQLLFAAYRAAGLWRGTHTIEATTPIIYLPSVASPFASAMALGALHQQHWGMLFFGAGMFSWLSLESSILHRLRTATPLPGATRPVIGIQLAPAFVGCAAYLATNGGHVDLFAEALIGYGLLNLVYLVRLIPWVFEGGFTLSMWAYSFGFGSMGNVGIYLYEDRGFNDLGIIGIPLFVLGLSGIALLAIASLATVKRRS
ncbi:dicarboxylate transporter/tellurite-resistance protein TehA [Boudabousia liubingyangii]|uniref:dicarboxylate transporter/tellurite-resistance protein TehA n=1 Tax=Boudabousia liubingyangii TaxID=1921764 RepID=UPI00093E7BA0|nr:dicarboxylate transporter/tellurite-resistance protein TehA [Boudabousia liubingyangii]OKL46067.1 dicarboxylate transporter/tellurite-resistance protein TehA [Boudabousia liubingyangii]